MILFYGNHNNVTYKNNIFLDTTMERNTLMAQCYPKLKDFCREKHGLEFQVKIFRKSYYFVNKYKKFI